MKFHIVKSNEKVSEILFMYNLTLDELKEANRYISRWDSIPSGTKLRIPIITKADDLEIMEMEPFIEDYYPSLDSVIELNEFKSLEQALPKEENKRKVPNFVYPQYSNQAYPNYRYYY